MTVTTSFATSGAASCACALGLIFSGQAMADALPFASTSDPAAWQVATNVGGVDGQFSSFPTTGFAAATPVTNRSTNGIGWIANNATGTNGGIGTWTFFVFQQTFDLSGYVPASANLQFTWAADDSGQGFAARGSWVPQYSLNGGALVAGTWAGGDTYSFGDVNTVNTGFHNGVNTISFYVEGNGVTDGFALNPVSFTATPVPEPASSSMLLCGLAVFAWAARSRRPAGGAPSPD